MRELQDQLCHVKQQLDSTMQALQASQLSVQVCVLRRRQRIISAPGLGLRTHLLGIDTAAHVQELEARLQTQVEEASKMGSSLQLQLDDAVRERDMWKVVSYL